MNFPSRKPTRLQNYDYSSDGAYFITICMLDKRCILSNIVGEGLAPPEIKLSGYGEIADKQIRLIGQRFASVTVDKYVIMPNHIHLILRRQSETGGASPSPTIPDVICAFKSQTTRLCKSKTKIFQRSFHDHVIRGENDYRKIWEYIDTNPIKWTEDCYYTQ